jgi:hypothetical protein
VLTELSGEEEISQPFLFTATMRSDDPDIKPEPNRLEGDNVDQARDRRAGSR